MQNLIGNFASQKARKKVLIEKKYEFIIKYNKRPRIKLSPRAPKFVEPTLLIATIFCFYFSHPFLIEGLLHYIVPFGPS